MSQDTADKIFLIYARNTIEFLKEKGIDDYLIAMIVSGIRSAAINAEFSRIKNLVENNPPKHYTTTEMEKIILGN